MNWRFSDIGTGGDPYPGETGEALVERQHVNDSYGQDGQFDDYPIAEYKFFFANGKLDVSGAHDLDGLRERNNVAPEHGGPMAVGNLIVQDGTAIWEVTSNVGLGPLVKALKKFTKDGGWDWGGVTDMKGEPLGDPEKLARKSYWLAVNSGRVQMFTRPVFPMTGNVGRLDIVGRVAAYRPGPKVDTYLAASTQAALEEFAADHNLRLAEYPGGGNASDYLRNHAPMGEDLELKNIPGERPEVRELERFHKDKDRNPEGIFKCPGCGRLFHRWHEYLLHRQQEEPQGDMVEDGKFPTIEESTSEMPSFTEAKINRPPENDLTPSEIASQFLHGASRLAIKAPKDMFTEPVPFIYDIKIDQIFVGHPGARHGEIEAPAGTKFTPGGIVEGEYQPGGKVVIESQSDTPYSIRHVIGLWYYQHPEFEVTGVMMTMPDGKQRKIAGADNTGAYVIGQAAQDPAVHAAWQALQSVGGVVYGVGGVVRDALLGKPSKDVDLLVTGLPAERVHKTLSKLAKQTKGWVDVTGKDFGVFRYKQDGYEVEIALPRTEKSTGERRVDFDVSVDHMLPIEKDLERRDFTANAIAVNLRTGEMVDPYGGASDIKNRKLRTVHEDSFPEDPTRLVRGLVAHSRHGLHPDPKTLRQMQVHAPDVAKESPERIQAELDKLFSSDDPGTAIRLAHTTGLLKYLMPEVEAAWGHDQNNPHHAHALGEHLVNVLDSIAKLTTDPDLRLAALLHDIGKPGSEWIDPATGTSHYYLGPEGQGADHELLGAQMSESWMRAMKYPVARIKRVMDLVTHHMYPDFSSPKGARKFLNRVGDHAHDLMLLREADREGKGTDEYQDTKTPVQTQRELVDQVQAAGQATDKSSLAINGNDLIGLGLQPGPAFTQILQALTDLVLENPELNEKHTLLNYVRHELMPDAQA